MNKTVTINIGGFIFHIEEGAYDMLQKYLGTIRSYFDAADGRDEIIADIEARIAELFREKIGESKEVIVRSDVEEMISVMGEPEAFAGEDEAGATPDPSRAAGERGGKKRRTRRIFRDPDNEVLGGVCSGLAAYFNIDPLWFRLAFAASFLFFGSGLLLYFLLWIIVPEASTTAEKLEMRGESVNVSNIEKSIREEMASLKKKFEENLGSDHVRKAGERAKSGIERFVSLIGNLILLFIRAITRILGAVFIIAGILLLIGFITSFFGSTWLFYESYGSLEEGMRIRGLHWMDIRNTFFESPWQFPAAVTAIVLTAGIPILGMILAGLRLLFNLRTGTKGIGLAFVGLWIFGIILSFAVFTRSAVEFSREAQSAENIPIRIPGDTLYLDVAKDRFITDRHNRYHPGYFEFIEFGDGKVYMGALRLDIRKSEDDSISVEVIKSAHGGTHSEAYHNTDDIRYAFSIQDSLILFDPFFSFDRKTPWRIQQAEVIVHVPVGVVIDLSQKMDRILYDVSNTTNTYDRKMAGHAWKMTEDGLECIDCHRKSREGKTDVITGMEQTEEQVAASVAQL